MTVQLHSRALEALVRRIRTFFELVNTEQHQPRARPRIPRRVFVHQGRGIELTPESEIAFERLIDSILKHNLLRRHMPRKTIERRVMNALLESEPGDSIEDLVSNLIDSLIGDIKRYRAYVPIGGIRFAADADIKAIPFGDMTLRVFGDASEFEQAFREPFLRVLRDGLSEQEVRREDAWFIEHLTQLKWRPCLVVDVETGLENVRHVVFDRVQPIADFWQFCVGAIMPPDWTPLVDYHVGSLRGGYEAFPVIAADESVVDLPTLPGGAPAVILTAGRIGYLEKLGLLGLADVFGAADGDDGFGIDALLRRAIQNFADGERATSRRQKLLSYTAAAELFFTRSEGTAVAVTHGIATLLAEALQQPYKELRRLAIRMYDARSRTIHDGATPSPGAIATYSALSQNVILAMIERRSRFADREAISAWSNPPPPRLQDAPGPHPEEIAPHAG